MKKYTFFTLLIFLLFGCQNEKDFGFAADMAPVTENYDAGPGDNFEPPAPPTQPQQKDAQKERGDSEVLPNAKKIIKDGDMTVEVDNLQKAKSFIDSVLQVMDQALSIRSKLQFFLDEGFLRCFEVVEKTNFFIQDFIPFLQLFDPLVFVHICRNLSIDFFF